MLWTGTSILLSEPEPSPMETRGDYGGPHEVGGVVRVRGESRQSIMEWIDG